MCHVNSIFSGAQIQRSLRFCFWVPVLEHPALVLCVQVFYLLGNTNYSLIFNAILCAQWLPPPLFIFFAFDFSPLYFLVGGVFLFMKNFACLLIFKSGGANGLIESSQLSMTQSVCESVKSFYCPHCQFCSLFGWRFSVFGFWFCSPRGWLYPLEKT